MLIHRSAGLSSAIASHFSLLYIAIGIAYGLLPRYSLSLEVNALISTRKLLLPSLNKARGSIAVLEGVEAGVVKNKIAHSAAG